MSLAATLICMTRVIPHNMKISTVYVRASLSMSKRVRVLKEARPVKKITGPNAGLREWFWGLTCVW